MPIDFLYLLSADRVLVGRLDDRCENSLRFSCGKVESLLKSERLKLEE